ncbi:ORF6N domain [Urinicoccus massiliensis]|uniref:ORF6N domain n=1 Tax=Urinicoccus massiliensis TaxID=1723382 RepID=A0A8H2M585_9FIRM|nr:ORF6N domain [Urinicoccus massiliensis]
MADENKEIVIVDDKTIQEKIYFIRGQKVMLDADLAEIYGYETKNFNRQVKIILKSLKAKILCFN